MSWDEPGSSHFNANSAAAKAFNVQHSRFNGAANSFVPLTCLRSDHAQCRKLSRESQSTDSKHVNQQSPLILLICDFQGWTRNKSLQRVRICAGSPEYSNDDSRRQIELVSQHGTSTWAAG